MSNFWIREEIDAYSGCINNSLSIRLHIILLRDEKDCEPPIVHWKVSHAISMFITFAIKIAVT